jgi:hypothetical protein
VEKYSTNIIFQVVHANAFKECCAMGMKLSVFENRDEQDCVQNYNGKSFPSCCYNKITQFFSFQDRTMKKDKQAFWLAASDIACKLTFAWCSGTNITETTYQWVPNHLPDQNCLVQYFETGVAKLPGLNDYECSSTQRYLCEE